MSHLLHWCQELFEWLSENSAAHSTALLVFITAWYALLTGRMTRAIARQTRSMIQPVASVSISWDEQKFYPKGNFTVKNLGTVPLLILDMEMTCNSVPMHLSDTFTLWDEHILAPGQQLSPLFDFTREIEKAGRRASDSFGYSLQVVVSDVAKQVTVTYISIPVLSVINHRNGMPLNVRWRYFQRSARWYYYRVRNVFKKRF